MPLTRDIYSRFCWCLSLLCKCNLLQLNVAHREQTASSAACVSAGVYVFGLLATDIFVNAGQLITGSLAPHFLSVCRPNYTALGCEDVTHFVSQLDACTGDAEDVLRARKTFPSKEAALSLYTALYLAVSVQRRATRGGPRPAAPPTHTNLSSFSDVRHVLHRVERRPSDRSLCQSHPGQPGGADGHQPSG